MIDLGFSGAAAQRARPTMSIIRNRWKLKGGPTMKSLRGPFRIAGFTEDPFSAQTLAKKYGRKSPVHLLELLRAIGETNTLSELKHIFVLVLENRSFDHLFGLLGLNGVDAVTGL